jgi:urea carboxylase-associated protein 2
VRTTRKDKILGDIKSHGLLDFSFFNFQKVYILKEALTMDGIWETVLRPGEKWSGPVGRGKLIKFTALEDGANLALLLYHFKDLTERYNMPDTLKAQHTAKLSKGNVLMSDNGRILASVVEDSLGWHDTISGIGTREQLDAQYGKTTYQELHNEWRRCGYENITVELVRNGLSRRDLVPGVNLFAKVWCDETGDMRFAVDHCRKDDTVTLRTEMDVLMILSNTPNPLDPRTAYPSVPVKVEVFRANPVDGADFCYNYRDENKRAFINTWNYYKLLGEWG